MQHQNEILIRSAAGVGAVAAERREELGLTQEQLAKKADLTRDWIVRFENGNPAATLHRVMRVLNALDASLWVADNEEELRG